MSWEKRFGISFKLHMILIGLIFAFVGWVMLLVVSLGLLLGISSPFEIALSSVELTWGFRIAVISYGGLILWKRNWIDKRFDHNRKWFALIFIIGGIGVKVGVGSLLGLIG
jgi:hypothetical protein